MSLNNQPMDEEHNLFHYLTGAYIAGETYNEYCSELKKLIPLKPTDGKLPKGNKALKALTVEAEVKSQKHIDMIAVLLKRDPVVYNNAYEEVGKIQNLMYKILRLSPRGQERILNLAEKIKGDRSEIEFWKDFENQKELITQ